MATGREEPEKIGLVYQICGVHSNKKSHDAHDSKILPKKDKSKSIIEINQ